MQAAHRPQRDLAAARSIFSSATITVGGLYLTTHSIAVTLIGTTAATALACWALWLPRGQDRVTRTDAEASATPVRQVADAISEAPVSANESPVTH
jgi:hypothetical protein